MADGNYDPVLTPTAGVLVFAPSQPGTAQPTITYPNPSTTFSSTGTGLVSTTYLQPQGKPGTIYYDLSLNGGFSPLVPSNESAVVPTNDPDGYVVTSDWSSAGALASGTTYYWRARFVPTSGPVLIGANQTFDDPAGEPGHDRQRHRRSVHERGAAVGTQRFGARHQIQLRPEPGDDPARRDDDDQPGAHHRRRRPRHPRGAERPTTLQHLRLRCVPARPVARRERVRCERRHLWWGAVAARRRVRLRRIVAHHRQQGDLRRRDLCGRRSIAVGQQRIVGEREPGDGRGRRRRGHLQPVGGDRDRLGGVRQHVGRQRWRPGGDRWGVGRCHDRAQHARQQRGRCTVEPDGPRRWDARRRIHPRAGEHAVGQHGRRWRRGRHRRNRVQPDPRHDDRRQHHRALRRAARSRARVPRSAMPSRTRCSAATPHTACSNAAGAQSTSSSGGNQDTSGGCTFFGANDRANAAAKLGPLGLYGGTTRTHALLPGSSAIDGGVDAGCGTKDQRGINVSNGIGGTTRKLDGDGDGVAACDAGSFEIKRDGVAPTVAGIDRVDASPTAAASVRWRVRFSEPVIGVDAADLALVASGPAGAAIASVTPEATAPTGSWLVTGRGRLGQRHPAARRESGGDDPRCLEHDADDRRDR